MEDALMPWDAKSFRERHNKHLTAVEAKKAAAQANAVLKSGVPEGEAIAIANKNAKKSRREKLYGGDK